jgi:hypothetical protein
MVTQLPKDAWQSLWTTLDAAGAPELGPGPRPGVRPAWEVAAAADAVASARGLPQPAALRLRALALLYADHHDPAHDIVQDLTDGDGSLIHGMLHRREPDYWNARYWFRRCESHPLYAVLGPRILAAASTEWERAAARRLTLPGVFDPFAFTDEVEKAAPLGETHEQASWLRCIQVLEFRALADILAA